MSITRHFFYEGSTHTVYSMGYGDRSPLERFLEDQMKRHRGDVMKMVAVVEDAADNGPQTWDKSVCRAVGDGVFEFKAGKLRLFWFWDTRTASVILVAHQWAGKGAGEGGAGKEQQEQIALAKRRRREYVNAPDDEIRTIDE